MTTPEVLMDNEFNSDHNNLKTVHIKQTLYPIAGGSNTYKELCYKNRSEHSIEDVPSSGLESEHAYDLRNKQSIKAKSTSRCIGLLASAWEII